MTQPDATAARPTDAQVHAALEVLRADFTASEAEGNTRTDYPVTSDGVAITARRHSKGQPA